MENESGRKVFYVGRFRRNRAGGCKGVVVVKNVGSKIRLYADTEQKTQHNIT